MDLNPDTNTGSTTMELAPADLAGKTASEPEIVRWVARNIDNPVPSPDTCPDPFAWTLLRECRSNPAFLNFFIEKLWSKLIPSRSQLEAQDDGRVVDGQPVLDMIARIRTISVNCGSGEGAGIPTEAHDLGRAGSIPAPAPIPDEFCDFESEE